MNFFLKLLRLLFSTQRRPVVAPTPLRKAPASPADPRTDPYFSQPAPTPTAHPAKAKIKVKSSLGLESGAYLPITREEVKEAARGKNLMANPWFGRRDLIPPADDLRTKLIDRGMVTQGFITSEELERIHEVGALMDDLKPTMAAIEHKAALDGEAAVKADRDARARIKAEKKAAAAERKRRRAEAIAQRKATDIVFLGRGVSGRLGDRTSNFDLLAAAGLPMLSTPADLAQALGISVPRLRWLAFHSEAATRVHYVQFEVSKRSGGTRTLSAPHRSLAEAQRWTYHQIVAKLPVERPAHGFVAGRSIITNARPHCGRAIVVNMDLEAFFPSIGYPGVRRVFERAGYSPAVATILALLCTECPRRTVVYDGTTYHVATGPLGLPQGACTSPGLSNQVARRLDKRLAGLAEKFDLTYTRYADDLSFSGDGSLEARLGYLMARVRHIAQDEGFAVNEKKTRVLRRHQAQTVTGLVVNDRPGAPRDEVRRLRAILHRARKEGLAQQNREGRSDYLAWLRGKIAYVEMARPEAGTKLRAELQQLLER
jgi:retron-type reverse transcriptase